MTFIEEMNLYINRNQTAGNLKTVTNSNPAIYSATNIEMTLINIYQVYKVIEVMRGGDWSWLDQIVEDKDNKRCKDLTFTRIIPRFILI